MVSGNASDPTGSSSSAYAEEAGKSDLPKALTFKMNTLDGEPADMSKYAGKVVMFVNVASKCGMTPQYDALQKLNESFKEKGLEIVGVPCNQFGGQEAGSSKEIKEFCSSKYHVTFDMMEKVNVVDKGKDKVAQASAGGLMENGTTGSVAWCVGSSKLSPDMCHLLLPLAVAVLSQFCI